MLLLLLLMMVVVVVMISHNLLGTWNLTNFHQKEHITASALPVTPPS